MKESIAKYFKRVFDDYKVLVKVNQENFTGTELIIHPDGRIEKTELEFDEEIYDDLAEDEFISCSPMEFNLHLKGLT